jgi:small basic protein (TIGR04137 family)
MSQHPSFKVGAATGKKRRNVLKRFERVALLQKRGHWKEGDKVSGLVKTKPED